MNLQQIKNIFVDRLQGIYAHPEADAIFSLICSHLLNYSKIELHTKKETNLSSEIIEKFFKVIARLYENEPIQYILGTTDFYNLILQVDHRSLIPRQETELLVDQIIKDNLSRKKLKILDLCTGSGCIAIALQKHLDGPIVFATDLSEDAIELARINASKNKCDITFIIDSILEPKKDYGLFDIIVSNPPYVRQSEKKYMKKNVLDFEPHLALFVDDSDPLVFYKAIAEFGVKHLCQRGIVYCEINEAFGNETANVFDKLGYYDIQIIKDLNNKPRFIKAGK